ncbi:hypothetical protein [Arsenicibacter rosenii]|uniref:Uncharacterized protein n=1 Tax=Arsenicibacter rosenii TaxID=1750698 RepID=A0A1S2VES4_9BACT|nr:hypothetical protein [Arsenicibacter rosenii]OIN56785.1 hypothetical protein BLX24_22685 [Arsenicibacter rosenii]
MITINLDLNKLTGDPIISFDVSENARAVDEKLLMRFAQLASENGVRFLPVGAALDTESGDTIHKYEIHTNYVSDRRTAGAD